MSECGAVHLDCQVEEIRRRESGAKDAAPPRRLRGAVRGRCIHTVDALIDDARRKNVRGPLTVLNVTGCDPRRAFDQGQAPQSAW